MRMLTFTKPMSLAYSRKHCLQMLRLYLRMIPHWFEHTRLLMEGEGRGVSARRVEPRTRASRRDGAHRRVSWWLE